MPFHNHSSTVCHQRRYTRSMRDRLNNVNVSSNSVWPKTQVPCPTWFVKSRHSHLKGYKMPKTLEAQDKLIREIFEGNYQFEIPEYQRPYAWTTDQTTELFDDLYAAMVDSRSSNAAIQYFLGSIVLIKNDRDPKSSVVDGQQ